MWNVIDDVIDDLLSTEKNNRHYEKYKNHLQSLVNFGSLTKYMMKAYLKDFIKREHTEAIVYDLGFNKIKSLFPSINKEDFDDIMEGYLMVADLGLKIGKKVQDAMNKTIESDPIKEIE